MSKLSYYLLSFIFLLFSILTIELLYMYSTFSLHVKEKNNFIAIVGLPDLAISNGANFIRHRSYSDTFSIFSNGPELLEYFPSTFTYSYSNNYKNTPSRIEFEN
ncbi:MAG: hypothetical protein JJV95_01000 [Sulfurospirillum sp.]|nr:hypothetical protein [Sulfurospirillum sp.]MBL0702546.1 hypothetical protein [Sulfurospirillum sp.]